MNTEKLNEIIQSVDKQIKELKSDPVLVQKYQEIHAIKDEMVTLQGSNFKNTDSAREQVLRAAERMIELYEEIQPHMKQLERLNSKKETAEKLLSLIANTQKVESSIKSNIDSVVESLTRTLDLSVTD